jgi:hypothetical protein
MADQSDQSPYVPFYTTPSGKLVERLLAYLWKIGGVLLLVGIVLGFTSVGWTVFWIGAACLLLDALISGTLMRWQEARIMRLSGTALTWYTFQVLFFFALAVVVVYVLLKFLKVV